MIRTIPLSLFLIALKMGKLSHQLKQEIIDLFNSGKKAYAITKTLNEKGCKITRQCVQYWITQHKCGYFNLYIPVEQPKKYRAVTERYSKIVQETLRVKNEQSCRDVMKVLQKDGYWLSISTTRRLIKDWIYQLKTKTFTDGTPSK